MTDVDQGMTMLQEHPATRFDLLWLFARSLLVAGVLASALYAGIYVAQDMRRGTPAAAPEANVQAPPGLELLARAASLDELSRLVGFTPVLPEALPAGTSATPRLDATQPDAGGNRAAEIRYSSQLDAAGVAVGPGILLRESRTAASDTAVTPGIVAPATVAATLACGKLTIEARLFFRAGTPDSAAVAGGQQFIDALSRNCR